jgi:hypothetical protein
MIREFRESNVSSKNTEGVEAFRKTCPGTVTVQVSFPLLLVNNFLLFFRIINVMETITYTDTEAVPAGSGSKFKKLRCAWTCAMVLFSEGSETLN